MSRAGTLAEATGAAIGGEGGPDLSAGALVATDADDTGIPEDALAGVVLNVGDRQLNAVGDQQDARSSIGYALVHRKIPTVTEQPVQSFRSPWSETSPNGSSKDNSASG